jgi:hypothetical protein
MFPSLAELAEGLFWIMAVIAGVIIVIVGILDSSRTETHGRGGVDMVRTVLRACVIVLLFVTGCAKQVTIRPPINSSLGFAVFQALSEIDRAPVHVGLLLEPKLQTAKISIKADLGTTEIAIGEVLSSKLVQALSYKFETDFFGKRRCKCAAAAFHYRP